MNIGKNVNIEHANAVKDYVKGGKGGIQYTFTDFFKRVGLAKSSSDFQHRGGNLFVRCPFHTDKTPSFSFSDKRLICKCFSCGAGGTYIDFILKYENDVNGRNLTYYELLENLLKDDRIMQAHLGINTIYSIINIFDSDFSYKPFKPKNLKSPYLPKSYLELANKIYKDKLSNDQKYEFILLMQAGMSPENIFIDIYKHSGKEKHNCSNDKLYDFTELLN